MDFKETTSDWSLGRKSKYYQYINSECWGEFARVVIRLKNRKGLDEEGVKNAKLIASAPELLRALTAITDNIDYWLKTGEPAGKETSKKLYDNAKKAIKKAIG